MIRSIRCYVPPTHDPPLQILKPEPTTHNFLNQIDAAVVHTQGPGHFYRTPDQQCLISVQSSRNCVFSNYNLIGLVQRLMSRKCRTAACRGSWMLGANEVLGSLQIKIFYYDLRKYFYICVENIMTSFF